MKGAIFSFGIILKVIPRFFVSRKKMWFFPCPEKTEKNQILKFKEVIFFLTIGKDDNKVSCAEGKT